MLQKTYAPLHAEDRIAGLLIHLEQTASPSLMLTTLAVRRHGGVEALVVVHLSDGSRHPIAASEARLMGRCIRDEAGEASGQAADWASSLDEAAEAAERQASAIILGMGSDLGVRQARQFGGR